MSARRLWQLAGLVSLVAIIHFGGYVAIIPWLAGAGYVIIGFAITPRHR